MRASTSAGFSGSSGDFCQSPTVRSASLLGGGASGAGFGSAARRRSDQRRRGSAGQREDRPPGECSHGNLPLALDREGRYGAGFSVDQRRMISFSRALRGAAGNGGIPPCSCVMEMYVMM